MIDSSFLIIVGLFILGFSLFLFILPRIRLLFPSREKKLDNRKQSKSLTTISTKTTLDLLEEYLQSADSFKPCKAVDFETFGKPIENYFLCCQSCRHITEEHKNDPVHTIFLI